MAGKYYLIKSKLNGQCLDVSRGGGDGSKVVVYKKHGKANQLWYDHEATGTIRSKCNDLCLTIRDHLLVVKAFASGDTSQQWEKSGEVIRNRLNHHQVIGVLHANDIKDSTSGDVGECELKNDGNQMWSFEVDESAGPAPQTVFRRSEEFYVVSDKNSKVLDIADVPQKDKKTVKAMPVMHSKQYPIPKTQVWYTDEKTGFIHSALNDSVFTDSSSGSLVMATYKEHKDFQWKFDGKKIVNGKGECLDIRGDSDKEGAELCAYKYKGHDNQHWSKVRI